MSWSEVKKLNSNFTKEPLDFNNYINDISTFNANSYVLDEMNKDLWRTLLKESLVMFGHRAIHSTVYTRMTDDDIDIMIIGNSRLGQCMNSFYRVDTFNDGGINQVLPSITGTTMCIMEDKILQGICRYLTEHTEGSSGVGHWLNTIYNVPALDNYPTLASILADSALWTSTIVDNEPLRAGICFSSVGNTYATETLTGELFNQYVETVCGSTPATMELLDNLSLNERLDDFWNNTTCAAHVFDNENSMNALIYHPTGFRAMCGNTTAISVLCEHTTYYDIIFNSWNTSGNTEATLNSIRTDLTTLNTHVSAMPPASHNIVDVAAAQASVATAIFSVLTMNSKADILAANFNALNTSTVAWTGIAASSTAMTAIAGNSVAMNKVASSNTALIAIFNSATAWNIVRNSSIAMTAIAASSLAYTKINSNSTLFTNVMTTAAALLAFIKSESWCLTALSLVQSHRANIISTCANTAYFTTTSANVGSGAGTWTHGLGNTFYIPTACNDDGDTAYYWYHGCSLSTQVGSMGSHSGTSTISSGVCLRGCKVYGSGKSVGYVAFLIFTAK